MKEVMKPLAGVANPLGVCRKNVKVGGLQVTVGGKVYYFDQRAVLFTDLVPDNTNPRYGLLVKNGGVTDEQMLLKLKSEKRHKPLREAIRFNKGLIEPIYVRELPNGKKKVLEGNRRLAALDDLQADDKDHDYFKYVPAYVIPAEMSDEVWLTYLDILHKQGKLHWGGHSDAIYYRLMLQAGIPIEDIAANAGRKMADVKTALKTCDMVDEYEAFSKGVDDNPEDKYAQLYQIATKNFAKTKKGRKTAYRLVMNGEVKSAKEIRKLTEIDRDDPATFSKLAAGEITLAQAVGKAEEFDEVGGSVKRFKSLTKTITEKFLESKKTLVKNQAAFNAARTLYKVLDGLIVAANDELEDGAALALVAAEDE